ncbi:pyridoxal-dependent decarboxylase [Desulfopila sp. IMCC35008]|uniref:pyridoxal phosphate-dependent decarboxylase family protein n=1 Tax=Desulfopila sp. IMCC35008 TaxID=2653858 RepID=UPI0013D64B37|nr:pyridoxal-dependent decarboxylase [Desulfopila sp. IMCC35008]
MKDKEVIERLFSVLGKYYDDRGEGPFVEYRSPSELYDLLRLDRDDCRGDWESVFTWIEQYLRYGVKTSQPSFVNRMWAGANLPSMLGEMVVAMSNTSACTYESAPVSTVLENFMIRQMLQLVGFDDGEGQMTTGSSNANMIAMMCARNRAAAGTKLSGLFGQSPLYGFVNEEAHYSMDKAANILGIGTDRLIKVAVNDRGEMENEALESAIARVHSEGGVPFFVAATAGTTVRGAYDAIVPLLVLREKYGFWLHVDGAWGGGVIMSERLREKYVPGLKQADSFTCDFHKMLGSSLMCNFLLVNKSNRVFVDVLAGGDGSYLFRDTAENDVRDLGSVSLQCGRRVDSLKWFLDWKYYGQEGLAERLESYLDLCRYAEQCVAKIPELELVSPRVSFNICFRYTGDFGDANTFNEELRTRLYHKGKSLVGIAYIKDILALRLLLTNTSVGRRDIDRFFSDLVEEGRQLEAVS